MDVRFPEHLPASKSHRATPKPLGPCCGYSVEFPPSKLSPEAPAKIVEGQSRLPAVVPEAPSYVGDVCLNRGNRGDTAFSASNGFVDSVEKETLASEDKVAGVSDRAFRELTKKMLELSEDQVVGLCNVIFISFPRARQRLEMNRCSHEPIASLPLVSDCSLAMPTERTKEKISDASKFSVKSTTREAEKPKEVKLNPEQVVENCMRVEASIYGEDIDEQKRQSSVRDAVDQDGTVEREALLEKLVCRELANMKNVGPVLPTVLLETADVYVRECEKCVQVDVLRIGGLDFVSKVCYETRDGTGLAGRKYTRSSGEIVFKEGQSRVTIKVDLVDDDAWDATVNFYVALVSNSSHNAQISETHSSCTIRILDDDAFPSNWCKEEIKTGQIEKIDMPRLLFEYFKMNMRNSVVRTGARKVVLVDQFSNIVFVFGLAIELYVMEVILCTSCIREHNAQGQLGNLPFVRTDLLLVVAVLRSTLLPMSIYLNYRKVYLKVAGASRKTIQANLLRKFLSYTAKSREIVCESYFFMAMTRDATDVVESGFCKVFELIKCFTRLILVLIFQLCSNRLVGQDSFETPLEVITRILPALLFPGVFAIFLKLRNETTVRALEGQQLAQNALLENLRNILGQYELIRDYGKKEDSANEFDAVINHYNQAFINCSAVIVNNKAFSQFITALLLSFYTVYGGGQVFLGLSLGKFVSTLQVYRAIGVMMGDVYESLLDLQNTFESLQTIVQYMNMPLDLEEKLELSRTNKNFIKTNLEMQREKSSSRPWSRDMDPFDMLCIEMRGVSFRYTGSSHYLKNITAEMPQGGFYALVGPPSEGKGTLLKILCGVILPGISDSDTGHQLFGNVSVPSHLRILNVLSTPCFVEATLLTNLVLGVHSSNSDGDMTRVMEICRKLGVSEATLQTLQQNTTVCDWVRTLSATEASLLHIARALIANPDVLCIHKPTLYLQQQMGATLYDFLRKFVSERGVVQDASKFLTRRPRTCIVTARSTNVAEMVDAAFHVTSAHGMRRLLKDQTGAWVMAPTPKLDRDFGQS